MNGTKFLITGGATWLDTSLYYLSQFSSLFDLLASLALLLASFRVLAEVNSRSELVSLLMAGVSKERLLTPFLTLATAIALLSYANAEWLLPTARDRSLTHRTAHKLPPLYAQVLPDQSTLVYRNYNGSTRQLFDLYWIRSPDDLWAIQELDLKSVPPQGRWVDHFVRTPLLTQTESFDSLFFFDLPRALIEEPDRFRPPDARALTTLAQEPAVLSRAQLHHKLSRPLLAPLLLLAALPYGILFARGKRLILPLCIALLAWLALLITLDSALILAENRLIPPWAIWLPIGALLIRGKANGTQA